MFHRVGWHMCRIVSAVPPFCMAAGRRALYYRSPPSTAFCIEISYQRQSRFETEVPIKNGGRQLGTIMDFYPRTLLPREQYDKVVVHSQLANKAAERDDNYWESVILNPGDTGRIRVTIELVSKDGDIQMITNIP